MEFEVKIPGLVTQGATIRANDAADPVGRRIRLDDERQRRVTLAWLLRGVVEQSDQVVTRYGPQGVGRRNGTADNSVP